MMFATTIAMLLLCLSGGGVAYGAQGYSHHAVEDLAVMRALPNMVVAAPGDPLEVRALTRALVNHPGPGFFAPGQGGRTHFARCGAIA